MSSTESQIAPSGAAAEITKVLAAEILRGEHEAGSPLRQASLAERFEVSRTPVREALHQLVALGLGTFQPHVGFHVRGISREEYLDAMVIRARLEGLAAERATKTVQSTQLAELTQIERELEQVSNQAASSATGHPLGARQKWSQANERFHDLLVRLANCPPLEAAHTMSVRAYPRDVTWLAVERYPSALEEYCNDHRGILDALRRSDPEAARVQACAHVERALDYLRLVFEVDGETHAVAPFAG
jgi:DNA-binding GntR family transcriptional regulator